MVRNSWDNKRRGWYSLRWYIMGKNTKKPTVGMKRELDYKTAKTKINDNTKLT